MQHVCQGVKCFNKYQTKNLLETSHLPVWQRLNRYQVCSHQWGLRIAWQSCVWYLWKFLERKCVNKKKWWKCHHKHCFHPEPMKTGRSKSDRVQLSWASHFETYWPAILESVWKVCGEKSNPNNIHTINQCLLFQRWGECETLSTYLPLVGTLWMPPFPNFEWIIYKVYGVWN